MKITDISLSRIRVPLKTPFKTALRTVETVEDIVVAIHTDTGHVGYGEAAATAVTGEQPADTGPSDAATTEDVLPDAAGEDTVAVAAPLTGDQAGAIGTATGATAN